MSQASKQVDWCLKKAERKIEEGRKKGQRNPKHRGLIKKEPNKKEAVDFIEKSLENLNFALSINSSQHASCRRPNVDIHHSTQLMAVVSLVDTLRVHSKREKCRV